MFKVGSVVIYGTEGGCKITEVTKITFGNISETKDYYILVPISNPNHKIYVPTDSEYLVAKMQKLMTYSEIKRLVEDNSEEIEWINDNKTRNKRFKEIISSYDRRKIFMLAKLIYKAKNCKLENVKKLYSSDEEILKKLVRIIYAELSYVVSLEEDDVLSFINGEADFPEKQ